MSNEIMNKYGNPVAIGDTVVYKFKGHKEAVPGKGTLSGQVVAVHDSMRLVEVKIDGNPTHTRTIPVGHVVRNCKKWEIKGDKV